MQIIIRGWIQNVKIITCAHRYPHIENTHIQRKGLRFYLHEQKLHVFTSSSIGFMHVDSMVISIKPEKRKIKESGEIFFELMAI